MSGVASIRIVKIKTKTAAKRTEIHNERKEGYKTGKHIDKNRSNENEILIGSSDDNFYRKAIENITGKKMTDEEWKKDSVEFIQKQFGKDNVINVVLHMDESTPHIHAVFTPTYINEKGEIALNARKYVDGKSGCSKLQTEYAKAVGYERGIGNQKITYDSIKKSRAILTQSINAELPPVEKHESAKSYRERVNPEYEKVRVRCEVAEADVRNVLVKHFCNTLFDKYLSVTSFHWC